MDRSQLSISAGDLLRLYEVLPPRVTQEARQSAVIPLRVFILRRQEQSATRRDYPRILAEHRRSAR